MPEHRGRSPGRKLGLIAPMSIAAALLLLLGGAWLISLRQRPVAPVPLPAPTATPAPRPAPTPEPPVSRADLLANANALASAFAANLSTAASSADALAKRRFALKIPFGCGGPQSSPGAAQAFYEYDAKARTVRLVARPATWTTLPLILDTTAPDQIEAVEGFWLPRPWTSADVCPRLLDKPVPASPSAPAAETLGLARLFTSGESRTGRRGDRPYEQVVRLGAADTPPLAAGYRLVLEGRFATFPDGRVAHCWVESPEHRPICLYAVEFDRVAFETGDTGRQLAEWLE